MGHESDFPLDELRRLTVAGVELCVARTEEGVFAIADRCSHEGAQLSDGDLEDNEVQCPLHSSRFDVRTGEVLGLPALEPVASYPVVSDTGLVFVLLSDGAEAGS